MIEIYALKIPKIYCEKDSFWDLPDLEKLNKKVGKKDRTRSICR